MTERDRFELESRIRQLESYEESRVFGGMMLLVALVVGAIGSWIGWW